MTTLQLALVCLTILFIALIGAGARREPEEPLVTEGQRVAIHLEGGQLVRGTVLSEGQGFVRLADPVLVSGGKEVKLAGNARLSRSGIVLIQEVETAPERG